MAMRLYTRAEFEAELHEKWGLTKEQGSDSEAFAMWETSSGFFITIPILPDGDPYPDYYLDEAICQIEAIEKSML